jgi:hypothetical protein
MPSKLPQWRLTLPTSMLASEIGGADREAIAIGHVTKGTAGIEKSNGFRF